MKKMLFALSVIAAATCMSCEKKETKGATPAKKEEVKQKEIVYEAKEYKDKIIGKWSCDEMFFNDKKMSYDLRHEIYEENNVWKSKIATDETFDKSYYSVKGDTLDIGSKYRIEKLTNQMMKIKTLNTPEGVAAVSFVYKKMDDK